MMTGNFENWAGDIMQLGAVYPFVGSEFLLFILGMVFWLGWHIIQLSQEGGEYTHDADLLKDKERVRQAIEM